MKILLHLAVIVNLGLGDKTGRDGPVFYFIKRISDIYSSKFYK